MLMIIFYDMSWVECWVQIHPKQNMDLLTFQYLFIFFSSLQNGIFPEIISKLYAY